MRTRMETIENDRGATEPPGMATRQDHEAQSGGLGHGRRGRGNGAGARSPERPAAWPSAVEFIRGLLGEDGAAKVRKAWRRNPTDWWARSAWHLTGGMTVRNRLREAGFGEQALGVANLDDVYIDIVEEAAGVREDR